MHAASWLLCMRTDVNHRGDNTTAHCEGYHSGVKKLLRAGGTEALRVDRLAYFLLTVIWEKYVHRQMEQHHGADCSRCSAACETGRLQSSICVSRGAVAKPSARC